jgi:hypothetical protein
MGFIENPKRRIQVLFTFDLDNGNNLKYGCFFEITYQIF